MKDLNFYVEFIAIKSTFYITFFTYKRECGLKVDSAIQRKYSDIVI